MAEMTSCLFQVSDPNGGAQYRPFNFSSVQQGTNYVVTITFDGGSPLNLTLSQTNPQVNLPDMPQNRVKPVGNLVLAWDNASPGRIIQFDGTLVTNAPVLLTNVVVASFD
jgi:hypothetical protein